MTTERLIEAPGDKARALAEKTLSEFPLLMSVTQVASVIGISRGSVYRLADRGDFRKTAVHLTGDQPTIRIFRDSVVDLLAGWLTEN